MVAADRAAFALEPLLNGTPPVLPHGETFLVPGIGPVVVDDGTLNVGKLDDGSY